jgi:uncharacterized repeat protein (TIGR03803 family)
LITNSSGNTLYGTASQGGSSGQGTVFAVNIDGTGFTNLHYFARGAYNSFGYYTNSDGIYPQAGLMLSGNTLYGTAEGGGSSGVGAVFAVNIDGTGFTNLYSFTAATNTGPPYYFSTNNDGAYPQAGLILSGNTLYGTAAQGGSSGHGTVFAVHTDGTGFTNLHTFAGYDSDGQYPQAGLILSGNTLYGTAGTVFAVRTDGSGFTNLLNADSQAGLILSGDTLYGTRALHIIPLGAVFAVKTNMTGFTNLYTFTALHTNSFGVFTNSDGAYPMAGLTLSGNTLYGTTTAGGSAGWGTVFAVKTDGTGFTNLHNFIFSDGTTPVAELILSANSLYGTTLHGGIPGDNGSSGNGTVFSLSFRPQLTITPSGTNVILSWPTNVAGFDYTGYILQETANLGSPTDWSVSDFFPPVIVNGQIRLTGPMLGPQRYYRLSQ